MKSALDLVKVLRLPRNLHLTLRTCCACHKICTSPGECAALATKCLRTCCVCHACHEICTSPCESATPATQFNPLRLPRNLLHLPRNSNPAKPPRCRANGPGVRTRPHPSGAVPSTLDFGSPATLNHVEGHTFSRFLSPATRAHTFSCACLYSSLDFSLIPLRASFH